VLQRLLTDDSLFMLERGLDAAAARQRVLANNLANADTPGFKRSDVAFSGWLEEALAEHRGGCDARMAAARGPVELLRTHPRHTAGPARQIGGPPEVVDGSTTMRNDGNNVDIDREMTYVAENLMWYQALAQAVGGRFSRLRLAISEGRR